MWLAAVEVDMIEARVTDWYNVQQAIIAKDDVEKESKRSGSRSKIESTFAVQELEKMDCCALAIGQEFAAL